VQTIITERLISYDHTGSEPRFGRKLWKISCFFDARQCQGAAIDLYDIDHGEPLASWAGVTLLNDMKITARSAETFTIKVGEQELTISHGHIAYRYMASVFNIEGTGSCRWKKP
jgi:hypothetical protein